jgi:hypothetical protein
MYRCLQCQAQSSYYYLVHKTLASQERGWAPEVPAAQEAEAGGSLEP